MFAWLTRTRKRPPRRPPAPPARLRVEQLESRYCPAAPVVTLSAQELANHQVRLTGHVTDESPDTVILCFTGKATGMTTANGSGDYSYTATASGLGTISVTGYDNEGLYSNTASVNFSSAVPTLTLSYAWMPNKVVHLTGHVTDEFPGGRTVTFTGAASGTTTADGGGNFDTYLTASQLGAVNATVTDQWNQASQAASITLTNTAPVIQDFTGSTQDGEIWVFTGRVVDEAPAGLVVTFSGLSAVSGLTATVNADGTFSLTVDLHGQSGKVQCQVTDWWNVASDIAWYNV